MNRQAFRSVVISAVAIVSVILALAVPSLQPIPLVVVSAALFVAIADCVRTRRQLRTARRRAHETRAALVAAIERFDIEWRERGNGDDR